MSTLILQAPAKLNLSLRVLGKRADGFHDIDTLMVKLPGLCDRLEFTAAETFSFECNDAELPTGEDNLVVKAVRAYEAASGKPVKSSIRLEKSIPHGAGLGGGSSDAAAALAGLDQLHDGKLGATRLHEIAASLGSDVPFFLTPGAARCTGRGEIISAVPSPAPLKVLLLKPLFSCPTPEAYRNWADSRNIPGVRYSEQEVPGVSLVNDLERPVYAKHLFLAELKQWLLERQQVAAALLCGSGSTVFAVLHDDADAAALAKTARYEIDPNLWDWAGVTG